ncbi:MAG: hypothetical protein R3C01_15315 [Planctomycetaceae bacterium]
MRSLPVVLILVAGILSFVLRSAAGQEQYSNYRDARRAAVPFLMKRDYAGSRIPLEASLRLAENDDQRVEAYESLIPAYRELPEAEKMVEASEYLIEHIDSKTKRSLIARSTATFYHQRGMTKGAIERYEETLRKDKSDIVSVALLAQIYSYVERNAEKATAMEAKLTEIEVKLDTAKAKRLEEQAAADPMLQAALYKDAGLAWLDAGNIEQALAAAEKSLAGPPEGRGATLVYFWRMSLGDIFAKGGQIEKARTQYQLSIAAAPSDVLKKGPQEKLDALK